jgi:hypothetical protein
MVYSQHRAVRTAVAALLSAGPALAEGRIFENRNYRLPTGVESQVHVNYAQSEPQRAAILGAPIDWDTSIEITVKARANTVLTAEDVADEIWTAAYARVMADQTLGGTVASIDPGVVTVQDDEADTGTCKLTWELLVRHETSNDSIAA